MSLLKWLDTVSWVIITAWWFTMGPTARAREGIDVVLKTRGLRLIQLKPQFNLARSRGSDGLVIATAQDASGNVQTIHFLVSIWGDLFLSNPMVREVTA